MSISLDGTAPRVGWLAVLALFFMAAILAFVAWSTHRTYAAGRRLHPNQAVNRLVLAKACAISGALLTGGYLGYAMSWVGAEADLAQERLTHSLLAAAAGALIVGASLALERACRVRNGQQTEMTDPWQVLPLARRRSLLPAAASAASGSPSRLHCSASPRSRFCSLSRPAPLR